VIDRIYIYIGWGILCSIVFFYLATRRKYVLPDGKKEDPKQPIKDYKEARDKLSIREKPKKDSNDSLFGGFNIGNIVGGFVVLLVGVSLAPTIFQQVNSAANFSMNNNSTSVSNPAASTLLNLVPFFFVPPIKRLNQLILPSAFLKG